MEIAGKYAVFIGGFGAIGAACCRELLGKGLKGLMVLDNIDKEQGREKLEALKKSTKCADLLFEPLDLARGKRNIKRTLKVAVEKFDSFDLLVNGAGIINERKPKAMIDINMIGLVEATLSAVPMMSWAGCGKGGMIVNISSVLGLEPGHFIATYSATCHALLGLTKSLSEHYFETTGIKYVAYCPGFTKTPLTDCFAGIDTFAFSKPITDQLALVKRQTVEQCAQNLVRVVEQGENGSVWISDLGELKQVKLHQYWQPQFESSNQ